MTDNELDDLSRQVEDFLGGSCPTCDGTGRHYTSCGRCNSRTCREVNCSDCAPRSALYDQVMKLIEETRARNEQDEQNKRAENPSLTLR